MDATTLRENLNELGFDWDTGEMVAEIKSDGTVRHYNEHVVAAERKHYVFREGVVFPGWVEQTLSVKYSTCRSCEDAPRVILADLHALYFVYDMDPGTPLKRIDKNLRQYLSCDTDIVF